MPSGSFVPRRTTRLVPGDDHRDIDVIAIAQALGDKKYRVSGLQPRFGGKAYDITWNDETFAAAAAASGVSINGRHYELRLLGQRPLDVSVFVTCEFPDEYVIELLRQYGDLVNNNVRHLRLKEEGLRHIENGIRVISFTRLHKALPSVIVYRGTPLGFRYTGQPKLCFKCTSPDHTVRDCPQKRLATDAEPEPTTTEHTQQQNSDAESDQDSDIETGNETERQETSEGESENDADGEMVIDPTPPTLQGHKRARPESNPASDNDATPIPTKLQAIPAQEPDNSTNPKQPSQTNNTPELFSATSPLLDKKTDTTTTPTAQAQMDKPTGPRLQKFLNALKTNGPARQHLIKTVRPADTYYKARGLWLQHTHGDYTPNIVLNKRNTNTKEIEEWRKMKGCIPQDAFAALLHLYGELTEVHDLFPSKSG